MNKEIFRKVALDKLSSPEQLDQMIRIAAPRTWLALGTILLIAAAATVWAFEGSIPTRVGGTGVLIRAGGVYNVLAEASGRVSKLLVADEAIIARGQIVAVLEQPDLTARLDANERAVATERVQVGALAEIRQREQRLLEEQRKRERALMASQAKQADADVAYLQAELAINRELEKKGLVTRQATIEFEQRIEQARTRADGLRNQIEQSLGADQTARDRVDEELAAVRERLAGHERELALLGRQVEQSTVVRSFYDGRVLAVKVDPGNLVTAGTPILSLEVHSADVGAVIFVDASMAKEIRSGMRAQITPNNVRREEYGYMTGVVTYVSAYPATVQEEMRLLENEPLIRAMQGDGADIQISVALDRDRSTRSGFKWSSRSGPPVVIDSGTMVGAEVVTRTERPIHLIFPAIKRTLGLY